jgi:hypothetical protein
MRAAVPLMDLLLMEQKVLSLLEQVQAESLQK